MIKLYQFPRMMGVPNAGPYCLKLETWLKMAGLDYEVVSLGDPRKAPKGKLPYIVDGKNTVADSRLAIEYLEKTYAVDLDANLSDREKAVAHALAIMLEEHYYWGLLYNRWIDENWTQVKKIFFSALPPIVKNFVPGLIQKGVKDSLHAQGLGRHDAATVYRLVNQDMHALSVLMGDNPFVMGAEPTTIDAMAYGLLANVLNTPMDSPLKQFVQQRPNLVVFTNRMTQRYYPDFAAC